MAGYEKEIFYKDTKLIDKYYIRAHLAMSYAQHVNALKYCSLRVIDRGSIM